MPAVFEVEEGGYSLPAGHYSLGRLGVAAGVWVLIPLALAARLGAIASDLAPAALYTGVACRDAARARSSGWFALAIAVCAG